MNNISIVKDLTEKIVEVRKTSVAEQWDYPKYFDALKELGVKFYYVDVSSEMSIFSVIVDDAKEPFSIVFYAQPAQAKKPIAPQFDKDKIKKAIAQNKGTTMYKQFLEEIAQAGVKGYVVDFAARKVIYKGTSEGEYEEVVPRSKS